MYAIRRKTPEEILIFGERLKSEDGQNLEIYGELIDEMKKIDKLYEKKPAMMRNISKYKWFLISFLC